MQLITSIVALIPLCVAAAVPQTSSMTTTTTDTHSTGGIAYNQQYYQGNSMNLQTSVCMDVTRTMTTVGSVRVENGMTCHMWEDTNCQSNYLCRLTRDEDDLNTSNNDCGKSIGGYVRGMMCQSTSAKMQEDDDVKDDEQMKNRQ